MGNERSDSVSSTSLLGTFHVPALDGIRGVSFIAVFAHHCVPPGLAMLSPLATAGWGAISVFFALSGFLVTYLLFREEVRDEQRGGPGRFHIWRFWGRRCLRIWPLYFLALLVGFVLLPLLPWPWSLGPSAYGGSDGQQALLERHGWTAPLFLMNWSMREHGWMTGGFSFGALWSVSVEEQFYILWPLTLLVVPKRFRRVMMISGIVLSAAYRTQLVLQDPPYYKYYLNTGMVADALLAGGLLAHVLKENGGRLPRPPAWVVGGVVAAIAYHTWTGAPGDRGPVAEAIRLIVLPWGAVGMLWCVLEPGPIARFFQWKPFLWLGQVSYGLYIWHTAVMHAVRHVLEPLKTTNGGSITPGLWHLTSSALSFVIVCLVAWASFRWFERPFLRWKEKLA